MLEAGEMTAADFADWEQFDKIEATFQPKRTDDLRPEAAKWIGYRGEFEASWPIEQGKFTGQWAFRTRPDHSKPVTEWPLPGWVPGEDLTSITLGTPFTRAGEPLAVLKG